MTHCTAALYFYLQALHTICTYDRHTKYGAHLFAAFLGHYYYLVVFYPATTTIWQKYQYPVAVPDKDSLEDQIAVS